MKGKPFTSRLMFAVQGIVCAVQREQSIRIHIVAVMAVISVLLYFRPAAIWWVVIMLTIGLVLVAEWFNAALETLADHLHPEQHPEIGAAKDMAAGAVLIAAAIALVVAVIFYWQI